MKQMGNHFFLRSTEGTRIFHISILKDKKTNFIISRSQLNVPMITRKHTLYLGIIITINYLTD